MAGSRWVQHEKALEGVSNAGTSVQECIHLGIFVKGPDVDVVVQLVGDCVLLSNRPEHVNDVEG